MPVLSKFSILFVNTGRQRVNLDVSFKRISFNLYIDMSKYLVVNLLYFRTFFVFLLLLGIPKFSQFHTFEFVLYVQESLYTIQGTIIIREQNNSCFQTRINNTDKASLTFQRSVQASKCTVTKLCTQITVRNNSLYM